MRVVHSAKSCEGGGKGQGETRRSDGRDARGRDLGVVFQKYMENLQHLRRQQHS